MPVINSSAPPRNLSSAPSGISTKSPIGGTLNNTSANINEWGCRDGMQHAKNLGNKEIPLAIRSRILAQSCVTPPYIFRQRIVLIVYLRVLLRGFPCFHDFSHGASYPYIPIRFCTCNNFLLFR